MDKSILENVIIRPVTTEKSVDLERDGKYVFLVRTSANKVMVQKAVEHVYKVKVASVNIMAKRKKKIQRGGKIGIKGDSAKKAIVTLKKGESIKKPTKKK